VCPLPAAERSVSQLNFAAPLRARAAPHRLGQLQTHLRAGNGVLKTARPGRMRQRHSSACEAGEGTIDNLIAGRIRLNYRISNSTAVGSLASFTVRTIPSKPTQTPSTMNTHRIGGRPMALQSCSKRASRLDMRGVLFGASFGHAGCTQRPGSSPSPQVGRREELRLWRLHQLVCGLYVGRRPDITAAGGK
jgi:hypothetical protein